MTTFRFAVHYIHPKLAICLETRTDVFISLWLLGYSDGSPSRFRRLLNDDCLCLERLYSIQWSGDLDDPLQFGESSRDNPKWSGDDWRIAFLEAKAELVKTLTEMLRWRQAVLDLQKVLVRTKLSPSDENRYKPQEISPKPAGAVLEMQAATYLGGPTFTLIGELFMPSGDIPMPSPFDITIPLSKEQAIQIGVPAANLLCALTEIGGIERVFVRHNGLSLSVGEQAVIDNKRVARLIAQCFGYAHHKLEDLGDLAAR